MTHSLAAQALGPLVLGLLAAIALLPSAAMADDLLDRYQVASDAKTAQIQAFYVARVPELAQVMPVMSWDDAFAAVATCTLAGQRAERGDDGAEAYVAAMEAWAALPVNSLAGLAAGMAAVLSDDLAIALAQDCGGMDLSMQRMEDSGMLSLMQQPGVMDRLLAE